MLRTSLHSFVSLLCIFALFACGEPAAPPPVTRDLDRILQGGRLDALVTFNSTGYFIYRGEPMGYEYELLQHFAKDHHLELRVKVIRDRSELWPKLNRGEGDVAAARLLRTLVDEKEVRFTRPLYQTKTAVVQRTGPPSKVKVPEIAEEAMDLPEEATRPVKVQAKLVERPADLAGKKVYLPNRSPLRQTLVEVEDQVSGDIEVIEVKNVASVEPLIRRVARGEIRLTVAPQNVAELKEEYFSNLTVEPALGPPESVVWAVRRNAPQLLRKLDEWIQDPENRPLFQELYQKYFEDRETYRERMSDEYLSSETGKLSEYDNLFRSYAKELHWDWRLLASQSFQESKFDPDAKSWAGARGLLQLMPRTAKEVGVHDLGDPEQNIAGATRYLQKLDEAWAPEIPDPDERLKFVFASYNAGRGHVQDAQRLAEKNGNDPKKWDDVAYWLLQLSKRRYYEDPVVQYGFVRGLEPVTYVEVILERFDHYRQFVQEQPEGTG